MTVALVAVAVLSGCALTPLQTAGPWSVEETWPAVDPADLHSEFYRGDGFVGEFFSLTREGSFEYGYRSCTFERRCVGEYAIESGTLLLTANGQYPHPMAWLFDVRLRPVEWKSRRFLPVSWGERIYLIDEGRMVEFCNQVNEGWEPRQKSHGWFLMREGDLEHDASGTPNLPEQFADYLIDEPLVATVISREDYAVGLDKGYDDGMRTGLRLSYIPEDEKALPSVLSVVAVEGESCTAKLLYGERPALGDKVGIWKRPLDRRGVPPRG